MVVVLERCTSTAMSDIIDEILTTPAPLSRQGKTASSLLITTFTPRITTPLLTITNTATSMLRPQSPLTDTLLQEINDQWRQTRQLVSEFYIKAPVFDLSHRVIPHVITIK